MSKCKNCGDTNEVLNKFNLCYQCTIAIKNKMKERDAIASPSAEMLDKINNEMNMYNTVYKIGEF